MLANTFICICEAQIDTDAENRHMDTGVWGKGG